jgi:hypothetical protein
MHFGLGLGAIMLVVTLKTPLSYILMTHFKRAGRIAREEFFSRPIFFRKKVSPFYGISYIKKNLFLNFEKDRHL